MHEPAPERTPPDDAAPRSLPETMLQPVTFDDTEDDLGDLMPAESAEAVRRELALLRARAEHAESELSSRIEQHQRAVNQAGQLRTTIADVRAYCTTMAAAHEPGADSHHQTWLSGIRTQATRVLNILKAAEADRADDASAGTGVVYDCTAPGWPPSEGFLRDYSAWLAAHGIDSNETRRTEHCDHPAVAKPYIRVYQRDMATGVDRKPFKVAITSPAPKPEDYA